MERAQFKRKTQIVSLLEIEDTEKRVEGEGVILDPHRLIEQMEFAAKLHKNFFWSKLMQDGADMIRKLSS
jgi:hypothetical protein